MRTPRVDPDPPVFLHSCDESEFKSHIVTNKTKLEAGVLLCEVQKRFELRTSPFAFLIIYLHAWERVQGVTGFQILHTCSSFISSHSCFLYGSARQCQLTLFGCLVTLDYLVPLPHYFTFSWASLFSWPFLTHSWHLGDVYRAPTMCQALFQVLGIKDWTMVRTNAGYALMGCRQAGIKQTSKN